MIDLLIAHRKATPAACFMGPCKPDIILLVVTAVHMPSSGPGLGVGQSFCCLHIVLPRGSWDGWITRAILSGTGNLINWEEVMFWFGIVQVVMFRLTDDIIQHIRFISQLS